MFRCLRVEFQKLHYSKALIFGALLLILVGFGSSLIEFRYVPFGEREPFYLHFMSYNATFLTMKILVPILLLLLVATLWGGESSNGMIQSFLFCKPGRRKLFFGKWFVVFFSSVFAVGVVFLTYTMIALWKVGSEGISGSDLLKMAKVYVTSMSGLFPILLLAVNASIFFADFQKSFSLGAVLLFLSLSLDSVFKNLYITPTYFLSHSADFYTSQGNGTAFLVLAFYIVVLTVVGVIVFDKKDIWR